ncbi:hypothetical protein APA_2744 [Pseudanabaena sp. lw0831]|uniref:cysteine dioxygenase family protein n=1 Tax=Pseudanabaena sp. lw0831 TaxID=1357935 RepID=UPI0019166474|nr:cupin [Pseudanabaena sp. lw0831]GBO54693.1 hypothetical protein APA_2744 [Pseudanabaena sp. lw0831]
MSDQDWLVTNKSECQMFATSDTTDYGQNPYRLHRFLTYLEDIIWQEEDDYLRLQKICPLVRRLLNSSEWILTNFLPPDPDMGWSVQVLYDEPDFPLTVQTVVWSPQSISQIHNHATWGIVALIDGQEKNKFWQRSPTPNYPDRIVQTGEHTITAGDILCLMPDAIHQIEAIADEPTISFNVYGVTDYAKRFQFDIAEQTAMIF